jgi:indoleamine 2,3-dioxygenase
MNLATASRQPQGIAYVARGAAAKQEDGKQSNLKGTGGTALIAFLKQARDETGDPAIEQWAQRFMSRQIRTEGQGDFFAGKPEEGAGQTEEVEVAGLAGTWTIDDEVGGICNY